MYQKRYRSTAPRRRKRSGEGENGVEEEEEVGRRGEGGQENGALRGVEDVLRGMDLRQ